MQPILLLGVIALLLIITGLVIFMNGSKQETSGIGNPKEKKTIRDGSDGTTAELASWLEDSPDQKDDLGTLPDDPDDAMAWLEGLADHQED